LGAFPNLSIVVPAYNAEGQLETSRFSDFKVVVVDDCSTDRPEGIVRSHGASYLRTPRQLGPAGARNLGAEHARGRIVVLIDTDVAVAPDSLEIIAHDFEQDPQLAAVFGSYDEAPAEPGFFSQYKNLIHHYVH
jgi:glycosyltransferase involved in cell wall biosynthesis